MISSFSGRRPSRSRPRSRIARGRARQQTLFVGKARSLLNISSMSALLGAESAIFDVSGVVSVRHDVILGRVAKVGTLRSGRLGGHSVTMHSGAGKRNGRNKRRTTRMHYIVDNGDAKPGRFARTRVSVACDVAPDNARPTLPTYRERLDHR